MCAFVRYAMCILYNRYAVWPISKKIQYMYGMGSCFIHVGQPDDIYWEDKSLQSEVIVLTVSTDFERAFGFVF